VEVPEREPIELKFPDDSVLKEKLSGFREDQGVLKSGNEIGRRVVIPFKSLGNTLPLVKIGGVEQKLLYTRDRLPIELTLDELPFEEKGSHNLLEISNRSTAYLRKLWDINREDLKISTVNPEFEKMLREWGYLNDN
jgi:hypothetical protein